MFRQMFQGTNAVIAACVLSGVFMAGAQNADAGVTEDMNRVSDKVFDRMLVAYFADPSPQNELRATQAYYLQWYVHNRLPNGLVDPCWLRGWYHYLAQTTPQHQILVRPACDEAVFWFDVYYPCGP